MGYDVIHGTRESLVGGASCPEVLLGTVGGASDPASQSREDPAPSRAPIWRLVALQPW